MIGFTIKTTQTAPETSKKLLGAIEANLGFVPNIYGVFASAPAALNALVSLNSAFAESSFTPVEQEIIALTTSVYNQCPYCVAGHSTFALKHGVELETVSAIRAGGVSNNPRLQALGLMTLSILDKKGAIGAFEMRKFLNAGFRSSQTLELLAGIAGKIMTNYASKFTRLPLDEKFSDQTWSPINVTKSA